MRFLLLLSSLAIQCAFLANIAVAGGMPLNIQARIKSFGPVINPPEVAKIYAPLQQTEPYTGVKVTRDLPYGPDEKNVLDVFTPKQGKSPRPVLIFVHGGAYMFGDKHDAGTPFNDNIMLAAAKSGWVGVNINYRLAPAHQWPAGAEDTGAAANWVYQHIAEYGGDPKHIFLMGHSAGAVHVASYLAMPDLGAQHTLAGAILVSGLYDLTTMKPGQPEHAYFGDDTSKYAARSPLAGLLKNRVPLMLVNAEFDPPPFVAQGQELEKALCAESRCPTRLILGHHSHISEVFSINTGDTVLWSNIAKFIKEHDGRS